MVHWLLPRLIPEHKLLFKLYFVFLFIYYSSEILNLYTVKLIAENTSKNLIIDYNKNASALTAPSSPTLPKSLLSPNKVIKMWHTLQVKLPN